MAEDTEKTEAKQIDKPWLFKPGQSGNPEGRPKGSVSIMTEIKRYLKENPEKLEELMHYYIDEPKMRELLLKMIDGMPKQDLGLGGTEAGLPILLTITKDGGNHTTGTVNQTAPEAMGGV